jgi:hypothetical protein
MKDKKNNIKGLFICDFCRNICVGNCHELLTRIQKENPTVDSELWKEGGDLVGRKQIIHCLGPHCETPCEFQRNEFTPYNENDGIEPLIGSLKYLVGKINDILIAEK